jgi:glutaredoxin 3
MAKVEMYTKTVCPYCVKAKNLLKQKGVAVTEYNLSEKPELMEEMQKRNPGARTVPQIFINDRSIGGCDELYALDAKGELSALLAANDKTGNPKKNGPSA